MSNYQIIMDQNSLFSITDRQKNLRWPPKVKWSSNILSLIVPMHVDHEGNSLLVLLWATIIMLPFFFYCLRQPAKPSAAWLTTKDARKPWVWHRKVYSDRHPGVFQETANSILGFFFIPVQWCFLEISKTQLAVGTMPQPPSYKIMKEVRCASW